jgi:RNA polymerase sigma-70 factor (ECF subfamily)
MAKGKSRTIDATIGDVHERESRGVHATLVRLLSDFELAEETIIKAFLAAVEKWGRDGIPENPRAWLVSTGRFTAIDLVRRRARFQDLQPELSSQQSLTC